jgi:hypothetical protein
MGIILWKYSLDPELKGLSIFIFILNLNESMKVLLKIQGPTNISVYKEIHFSNKASFLKKTLHHLWS